MRRRHNMAPIQDLGSSPPPSDLQWRCDQHAHQCQRGPCHGHATHPIRRRLHGHGELGEAERPPVRRHAPASHGGSSLGRLFWKHRAIASTTPSTMARTGNSAGHASSLSIRELPETGASTASSQCSVPSHACAPSGSALLCPPPRPFALHRLRALFRPPPPSSALFLAMTFVIFFCDTDR